MSLIQDQEKIIVIDFGGQYNQLVARRVRECNVYCEIYSYKTPIDKIKAMNPKGIILTGGPNSCYEEGAPTCTEELFRLGMPVLGLCYGAQLMQHVLGGEVKKADAREYGKTEVFADTTSPLFTGVSDSGRVAGDAAASGSFSRDGSSSGDGFLDNSDMGPDGNEVSTICWMSHFDYISKLAPGFRTVAHTVNCPVAAAEDRDHDLYAIQFHPEVLHTAEGTKMLRNFVRNICGCAGTWRMDSFVEASVSEIRQKVGNGRVLLALSGGVDSSVLAALLARAIGPQLTCVFVDHGLMRKNEGDEVEAVFGKDGAFDINFVRVNAADRYYIKLAGVDEPEQKRKIIGAEFIRVFEEEAMKIGTVEFLAQGTIYPDVVESGLGGESAVIKSHHNVGGLPDHVDFKEIIEPLRNLFKDEVRKVGLELGIPEYLVFRQPFPGPGLGIRIIGDITAEKVRMVQDADAIYREEIGKAAEEWRKVNIDKNGTGQTGEATVQERFDRHMKQNPEWMPDQYFAALTNVRSVGVMGDERTYDYAIALRAVRTIDFMTAEAADIPWDVLQKVMSRIINEVRGVNRVFYDLTSKPPGTIEME
ncbi:MAG: glutamine-hydrolyzing GMP synthase [Lachnospiraceae bacterium]|nr:glutamine-hydrolyzing GMP synthase [Lachnospiraceae bacterium]